MLKPLGMSESPLKFMCCTELLCLTGVTMNCFEIIKTSVSWILKEEFASDTRVYAGISS